MNIKKLIKKYSSIISYIFFGICTTLVNIGGYTFCTRFIHLEIVFSTILAWLLSVAFAYITNRQWVFHSTVKGFKQTLNEISSFFVCRLATGAMDIVIMYIFVSLLHFPDIMFKILSNIFVIIINYVASKLFIFRSQ